MQQFNYTCPKCNNTQCEVDEFRATGGFLSKIFDIRSKRFTTVTCTQVQLHRNLQNKIFHARQRLRLLH